VVFDCGELFGKHGTVYADIVYRWHIVMQTVCKDEAIATQGASDNNAHAAPNRCAVNMMGYLLKKLVLLFEPLQINAIQSGNYSLTTGVFLAFAV